MRLTAVLATLIVAVLGALLVAAPAQAALGDRVLKRGARGQDVRVLQGMLTKVGYPTDVDGRFGAGTKKSVIGFQGVARQTPDGIVRRATVAALRGAVASVAVAPAAVTGSGGAAPVTGAAGPAGVATITPDGTATPPTGAPPQIGALFAAANKIARMPYRYGGGHGKVEDTGYDCSGSVSYALIAAGLLKAPMASGEFMSWGDAGPGSWITIYTHKSHMFMIVAGIRFDTSGMKAAGTRWQPAKRSLSGFTVRHPRGF